MHPAQNLIGHCAHSQYQRTWRHCQGYFVRDNQELEKLIRKPSKADRQRKKRAKLALELAPVSDTSVYARSNDSTNTRALALATVDPSRCRVPTAVTYANSDPPVHVSLLSARDNDDAAAYANSDSFALNASVPLSAASFVPPSLVAASPPETGAGTDTAWHSHAAAAHAPFSDPNPPPPPAPQAIGHSAADAVLPRVASAISLSSLGSVPDFAHEGDVAPGALVSAATIPRTCSASSLTSLGNVSIGSRVSDVPELSDQAFADDEIDFGGEWAGDLATDLTRMLDSV